MVYRIIYVTVLHVYQTKPTNESTTLRMPLLRDLITKPGLYLLPIHCRFFSFSFWYLLNILRTQSEITALFVCNKWSRQSWINSHFSAVSLMAGAACNSEDSTMNATFSVSWRGWVTMIEMKWNGVRGCCNWSMHLDTYRATLSAFHTRSVNPSRPTRQPFFRIVLMTGGYCKASSTSHFSPVLANRFTGKNVSEMTYFVSTGT